MNKESMYCWNAKKYSDLRKQTPEVTDDLARHNNLQQNK